ncbi:hypothetical protein PISMIDRAFT_672635 [Pisolithus microcarpus 441]|uniref:Uncharacterized protein n=1 Tax=Pisolithus microcarpus 441 TaxID=765257 RepID=A0A0C9ZT81_9AGAM|nr:hypothetical protein PISMIDRAFT_672635 [Pisolithus microcarpus 441]
MANEPPNSICVFPLPKRSRPRTWLMESSPHRDHGDEGVHPIETCIDAQGYCHDVQPTQEISL